MAKLTDAEQERDEWKAKAAAKEEDVLTLLGGGATEYMRTEGLVARLQETRELAKRAKAQAAAPDYDEEAIRDALWATVDAVLAGPLNEAEQSE